MSKDIQQPQGDVVNGSFKLSYEEEGVFLSIMPAKNGGKPVSTKEVAEYINRKNIIDADLAKAGELIVRGAANHEYIAPPQQATILDDQYIIETADMNMSAYLTLVRGEEGGKVFTAGELIDAVKNLYKFTYGVDEVAITSIANDRPYGMRILIASGKAPEPGKDAEVNYLFDLEKTITLEMDEDDRVDFRSLNLIENVDEGKLLATKTPAGEGDVGYDIYGKILPSKRGKDVRIPNGRNTRLSDDKLSLFAATDGSVEMLAGKVVVLKQMEVKGDVSLAVGNIDFVGDVIVKGNVSSGFTVKAEGDIVVNGIVEDATLIAGNNIILKRGIQGVDKGKLIAGGGVYAKFIERSNIEAQKAVVSESIMHSTVVCEGIVETLQGKGAIVGGKVSAGSHIGAKVLGGTSGSQTIIEIGFSPQKRHKLTQGEERLKELRMGIERSTLRLNNSLCTDSSDQAYRLEATRKLLLLKKEADTLESENEELRNELKNFSETGCVHVLERAYPGVKITVSSVHYFVKDEVEFTTFRKREGKMELVTCRISSGKKKKRS